MNNVKATCGFCSPGSPSKGSKTDLKTQSSSLNINNTHTRYHIKYGSEFKAFLDARDQVM